MIFNFLNADTYALSSAYEFQVPEYGTPPKVDIHDTLFELLEMFLGLFKYCFEFLKGIEFLGTNLLSFTITLMVLGTVFPIIFSLVSNRAVSSGSKAEAKAREKSKPEAKQEDRQYYFWGT